MEILVDVTKDESR